LLISFLASASAAGRCPHNQVLMECGSACAPKCGVKPMMCMTLCIPNICQCPKELPWQKEDGSCVRDQSECDDVPECPHNQKWTKCGSACPLICGQKPKIPCTKNCIPGVCQCPPRTWQKTDGSCVKYEHECDVHILPPACPIRTQVWDECGTACPLKCGQPKPEMCILPCKEGCQCPKNWWQKDDGTCVRNKWQCKNGSPGPYLPGPSASCDSSYCFKKGECVVKMGFWKRCKCECGKAGGRRCKRC